MSAPRSAGFALIEVVVTFFVIGGLLIVSSALLYATRTNQDLRDRTAALRIAHNTLEDLRAGGYAAVPASGSFTDPALAALASSSALRSVSAYNDATKRVDLTITWEGRDRAIHTVSLSTLITEEGGL